MQLKKFFSRRFLLLIAGCALIGFGERQSMDASHELYILNMLTDHYYLIYMMMPLYLLFFYQSMDNPSEFILIRMKYFWRAFLARATAVSIAATGFVGVQLLVFFAMGMGLPGSNTFPVQPTQRDAVAALLGKYFPTPVLAIAAVAVFMILGLCTVSIAVLTFRQFFSQRATMVLLISLYIFMTFGIKLPGVSQIPFISINNYIIFHHNFAYPGKLAVTVVSMLVLWAAVFILVKRYWQKKPAFHWQLRGRGIAVYYARHLFTGRHLLICTSIILLISVWKALNAGGMPDSSFRVYMMMLFYGHGSGEFHLLAFLEMLVMNSTPLYLLAVFVEEESRDRSLFITIRLKKKASWLYAITLNGAAFIAFYVVALVLIGRIVAMAAGLPGQADMLVWSTGVLKFLDIFLQFLFLFALFAISRSTTWAFLGVLALNVLSIWSNYMPAGISSIARSAEMDGLLYGVRFGLLTAALVVMWTYVRGFGFKKIFR